MGKKIHVGALLFTWKTLGSSAKHFRPAVIEFVQTVLLVSFLTGCGTKVKEIAPPKSRINVVTHKGAFN